MAFATDSRDLAVPELIRAASAEMLPQPTGEEPRLPVFPGIKVVAFDVYGTLFISGSGDISLAEESSRDHPMREALHAAGLTALPEGRLDDRFLSHVRAAQEERRAAGIEYAEVEIREVWQAFTQELGTNREEAAIERLATDYETRVNPVWPMPGLAETLATLREAGLGLAIVSNAQFFTPGMFAAFLGKWPEEVGFPPNRSVWSYQLREAKPSTRLYEVLATELQKENIAPAEVLYVGNDLRNDVWPAGQVGLRTALFAGDGRSLRWRRDDPRVADVIPDAVVTDLRQIPAMVGA